VWDVSPPHKKLLTLSEHTGFVTTCAFSPNGKLVASGGDDKNIFLWDSTSGDLKHTLAHDGEIASFRFLSDDRILSVTGNAIFLFDLTYTNPCFAQFLHPYPTDFTAADMRGDQIIAFDQRGGIYYLKVDNLYPKSTKPSYVT